MKTRTSWFAPVVLALLAALSGRSFASPVDAKVGDVRYTYAKEGTVLRADATATGAPLATLPGRTGVTVLEIKLPWMRVRATVAGQPAPVEGWLRGWQTIEPEALAQSAPPAHLTGAAGGPVDTRDVAAAGRQFDAATEGRYSASTADLQRAYPFVDRMEADTQALDPAEVIGFILEGTLGQRGRDFLRPARLPPERAGGDANRLDFVDKLGNLPGNLPGPLGKLFGKHGGDVGKAIKTFGKAAKFFQKMKTEFTPSQEYYLGRAVAANAIAKYGIDRNEGRRHYVKVVGDAVVRLTERLPVNYGGYHFDVLDSDEINGISGPGGFVLVTRGAVEACRTEDELAGILGHELGHIKLGHGTEAIRRSKAFQGKVDAVADLLGEATDLADNRMAAQLLDVFQSAVTEGARTAIEHSYSPEAESQADLEGTYFLVDVVYDRGALRDLLRRMGQDPRHQGDAAHMPPESRARALDPVLEQYVAQYGPYTPPPGVREARASRFNGVLGRPAVAMPR